MSTTTLALVAAFLALVALASAARRTSVQKRLYDGYLERRYTASSLTRLTREVPCARGSETLSCFDSGPPRSGGGEPILLLHGFSGDKGNWLEMVKWLSPHHRLVAVDLAGHGESDAAKDDDYSFERQAERARCVAVSLEEKLVRYHVLGHSMGGAVAIKLASLYPGEVLSLGLIASAGAKDQHTDAVMDYIHGKTRPGTEINPLIVTGSWSGGERLRFVTNRPWRLELVSRAFNSALTDAALPKQVLYELIFEALKARETQKPLTCEDLDRDRPTFYLYGEEDRVLRPYWASCFSAESRDSWVIEKMPGVGHTPIVEDPEKTAKAYLKFLESAAASPGP